MNRERVNLSQTDILIVDDTPDNLRVLTFMLAEQGYKVRKALNGQMALTVCKNVKPDLILLDILMPDLNGYEVCQQLKASEKTRDIPIIFISALDDVWDKVKAFSIGGADYITKPFQIEEVLARVQHQLTIQALQRQLVEQNTQLQTLNADLIRSNAELEQFTSIASHDLQLPLTAISLQVDLLAIEVGDRLNPQEKKYLTEIQDIAVNMGRLIRDLLAYAQAGKKVVEEELVDCNLILAQVLSNLKVPIESYQATVMFENLPWVKGQRTQLEQLFQNLIGNAIKFSRAEVQPKITILAEEKENYYLFRVCDNGIGIDSQKFEQIFKVFGRLHSTQDFPGTGIGLAICKKIVEQSGGQIWVESKLNVGTTFYFTLASS